MAHLAYSGDEVNSIIIQIAMALAIGLLSEVIGLWYFNHYLNIPADRGLFADLGFEFFPDRYNGQLPDSFPVDMNIRLGFGLV